MQNKENSAARKARTLYAQSWQGVLSTLSLEMPGHPFGSVTTFTPDEKGRPVLQISRIAEHTRNIDADPRVSLILVEGGDDFQQNARLTLVGKARRLEEKDAATAADRFFRRFPHAEAYQRAHDFSFYVIEPARLRYIGGFGQIHWLETDAVCQPNPFDTKAESAMVSHMNNDHTAALIGYCRMFDIALGKETPRLSGIDGEGFDLMLGKRLARIDFDKPVSSADEVRKAMVELALRARELFPVAA